MTYQEYNEARNKEIDALPLFWAFGKLQFMEQLKERGLTMNDLDQVRSFGGGGYYLKKDEEVIFATLSKRDILPELMKDFEFAKDAIYYEMCNHEYSINYYQRNWDVLNCFGDEELTFYEDTYDEYSAIALYMKDLEWEDTTKKAFWAARKQYFKDAEKNNWF